MSEWTSGGWEFCSGAMQSTCLVSEMRRGRTCLTVFSCVAALVKMMEASSHLSTQTTAASMNI